MSDLGELRALLIEPNAGMRVSLHNMLNLCGITKIEHALSAGAAVRAIQAKNFDLLLCEYELGVGQDGQYLAEAGCGRRVVLLVERDLGLRVLLRDDRWQ